MRPVRCETPLLTLVVIFACCGPVLLNWDSQVVAPYGGLDAVLQSGLLEWSRSTFGTGDWSHLPIQYPVPGALAFMDSLLGQALLMAPLRLLGNVSLAAQYNFAYVGSLLLAGVAMILLWVASGGGIRGAGIASVALVGSPYTIAQLGHLNQLPMPFVIVAMAILVAVFTIMSDRPVWAHGSWWLLAACFVIQASWGWYGTAYAVIACFVIGVSFLVDRFCLWRKTVTSARQDIIRSVAGKCVRAIIPLSLAVIAILWLAEPYRMMERQYPEYERARWEVSIYNAQLKHFVHGGAYRIRPADIVGRGETGEARYADRDRQVLHFGWIATALAIFGFVRRRQIGGRQLVIGKWLAIVGITGLVLSLGESLTLIGTDWRITMPFEWLRNAIPPFKAFRMAWRFSFLTVIAVAWWAAAGWQVFVRSGGGKRHTIGAFAILAALLIESVPYNLPAMELGFTGERRPITSIPAGPLLSLPAPRSEVEEDHMEVSWLLWSLETERRVTGGATGWVPPDVARFRKELYRREQGQGNPVKFIDGVRAKGVVGAVIALRPGDDERISFWREQLARSGAVRSDEDVGDSYELYYWPDIQAAGMPNQ